jgi:hypothetical protein
MTNQLIHVVEPPVESNEHREWPSVDEDGRVIRADSEKVLFSCQAPMGANWLKELRNTSIWKEAWQSPEPASVEVTDERVTYAISKFDKGNSYFGGFIIDTAIMTAVSKARAASRRQGKIAVGQLLHLWITSLGMAPPKGLMKRTQHLGIRCQVSDTQFSVYLELAPDDAERVASDLAKAAARQRLEVRGDELSAEQRARLTSIAAEPVFESAGKNLHLAIPGALKVGFTS